MDEILQDITQVEPLQIQEYYRPYQPTDDPRTKMRIIQRNYRRTKVARNRIGMLVNMYFAGDLLDSLEDIDYKWAKLVLSPYQRETAVKTFTIFQELGISQLYRTKVLTTWQIQRLTKSKIQDLISRAKSFLTTTFEIQVGGGLSTEEIATPNITWDLSINNDLTLDDVTAVPNSDHQ
jgi:hypothetical protein